MNKEELVKLGKSIVNCQGTEEEIEEMIDMFNSKVPHPNGANLFFYPENYNARRDDLSKYNPTVEEVVEKVLNYKPIIT